jgi:hypothetical protein
VPANAATYIAWAEEAWNWFAGTGMINANGTINDGLTTDCVNNGQAVYVFQVKNTLRSRGKTYTYS